MKCFHHFMVQNPKFVMLRLHSTKYRKWWQYHQFEVRKLKNSRRELYQKLFFIKTINGENTPFSLKRYSTKRILQRKKIQNRYVQKIVIFSFFFFKFYSVKSNLSHFDWAKQLKIATKCVRSLQAIKIFFFFHCTE